MRSTILVATHRPYQFPEDPLYHPIQVGTALRTIRFGYLYDSSGDNISDKNDTFCELTALYWAWKNRYFDDSDYVGLVHYRRYFAGDEKFASDKFGELSILDEDSIKTLLSSYDVIVPKKRHYYIETISSHYAHAHYHKDMDILREVVLERSPEYLQAFDQVLKQRSLYLYNMFVMSDSLFDSYCQWLFPLLFSLEEKIDVSGRDAYQKRVFGFMGERLFNVWLRHNTLNTVELEVVNLEGEDLFNKGMEMLKRKIFSRRRRS
ncbi:MAG: DUF4422 domain-containing protein [Campylobacterota bacterium]|nr:DUF4422 domain-containing protein [Campylobacterota bacterium]